MLDAVLGFIGKGIDAFTSSSNAEKNNATQLQIAHENMAQQREFAQQGIRWKVDDAKAAGLHPLAALGAQTTSYSPVSVGDLALPRTNFGDMGQDIGRAISAGSTANERDSRMGQAVTKVAQTFQLEKMNLENELLKTSIAKERAQLGPPLPVPTGALAHLSRSPARSPSGFPIQDDKIEQKPEDVPQTAIVRPFGYPLKAHPYFSDGQQFEDRYGESELASTIKFGVNTLADHYNTYWPSWSDLHNAGQSVRNWMFSGQGSRRPHHGRRRNY